MRLHLATIFWGMILGIIIGQVFSENVASIIIVVLYGLILCLTGFGPSKKDEL